VSLQPKVSTGGGESTEKIIIDQCEVLEEQVPQVFDLRTIKASMESRSDPDAMKVVLFQEIERYNVLLRKLHSQLRDTKLAVAGLVGVTPELENVISNLLEYKVPLVWSKCYPSSKPLGSWMRDLGMRCDQLITWSNTAMPTVYWLPGFTYPTGFLTALLQTCARKNGLAIDSLSWEFPIVNQDPSTITQYAKEGSYVHGFILEGARWDFDMGNLTEPVPMELYSPMPIIHFKPVDGKKKSSKGVYPCPVYMYPVRTGTRERPSYVITCDLKSGKVSADHWVKRGTALLLSTAL